jgi:hypothetical protein
MEDNFNATEPQTQQEDHSGAQERVVDAQQSQTGGYAALDGREDFVDPQEEDVDDNGSDAGEGGGKDRDPDGAGQDGAGSQTRQDNAAARAARLRAQREADAVAEKRVGERLAKSGLVNPYTNQPFTSLQEVENYGARVRQAQIKQMAKESGRSEEEVAADLADKDFVRQMRQRADSEAAQHKAEQERQAFIEKDAMDFVTRYPDVDLDKLEHNESFREFCGSRFGKEPLGDLYGSFLKITGAAGQAAVAKQVGRSARSTGGGSTGGTTMTPGQQKALDAWNAANPDMAMTAKEYLARAGK